MSTSDHTAPRAPKQSGVYQIRNLINGKVYIGSAVDVARRWNRHRSDLRKGIHHSRHLQRAWDKHGEATFAFELLEAVASEEQLVEVEQRHLDARRPHDPEIGYNISPTAGSALGVRHAPETNAANSARNRGRKLSPEHIAKVAAARRGKKLSDKARANMRASWEDPKRRANIVAKLKGRPKLPEQKAKQSAAMKGRRASLATCAKLSRATKQRMADPQERAKISRFHRGRKISPETRARMSVAQKGHRRCLGTKRTIEQRIRQSEAAYKRWRKRYRPAAGQTSFNFTD